MKKIGVVEGYYGEISKFDDRKKIIESLNKYNLNFYLYAAKEDPFLRSHLDIEYTKEWLSAFRSFVNFSTDLSVEIGVGLAPVKTAYLSGLKEKIKIFSEQGVKSISILFDDIEGGFCFEKKLEIFNDVKTSFSVISFDFCPTVYATELIDKDKNHNEYFNDFMKYFPKSNNFFWTGDKVISLEMSENCQSSLFGFNNENIYIWDNYFTIDSCPKNINLSFCDHLSYEFISSKNCYLINLTGMPRTDKLLVELFGAFKEGERDSFETILLRHGVDERLLDLIHLLNPNSKKKLQDKDRHKIHEIMFTWFHPLKNEWYPYLHNLKKGENL